MTEKILRKALAAILHNEDNPDLLPDIYGETEMDKEALIQSAVNDLCTPELLEYVNANMETIPVYSITDREFKKIIKLRNRQLIESLESSFPLLGNFKVCPVGSDLDSSSAADGLIVDSWEMSCICDDGELLAVQCSKIEFYKKFTVYRKLDQPVWSLNILNYENVFPEKFKDFWE